MKKRRKKYYLLRWFAPGLGAITTVRAQVVNDGATSTLSNISNSFAGDVTIGSNGAFTLLMLSDNALLTNSANGVIGRNVSAKSNEVRLISASARWRMGNNLYLGSNGAASRLLISNGAFVDEAGGLLAFRAESSNNAAVVTGPGSVWSNRTRLSSWAPPARRRPCGKFALVPASMSSASSSWATTAHSISCSSPTGLD